MDGTTALAVLGLRPGATAQQIKAAFRAKAKLVHPDHDGAADSFVDLRQAYHAAMATLPTAAPATSGCAPMHLDEPAPSALLPRCAGFGRAPRRAQRSRWLAVAVTTSPSLDVLDIDRPPAQPSPAFGRRGVTSFEDHLALALAG